MAYCLMAREPGKKVAKMWAGKGKLTNRRIYAVQYPDDKREYLEAWCEELRADNPGWEFFLRHLGTEESCV